MPVNKSLTSKDTMSKILKFVCLIRYIEGENIGDSVISKGNYEVERMAVRYPAKVYAASPFDPKLMRIRGKYDEDHQRALLEKLQQLN